MSFSLLPRMNQLCKVCGEPAAGFHFGAFTCEGCKVRRDEATEGGTKHDLRDLLHLHHALTLPFSLLQSFFGRTYNNLSQVNECKNGGQCVINKQNRTSCKACRLRKCLMVGMSKSGSR